MTMDFTYEIPNEEKYLAAVIVMIKMKGNTELATLLSRSKCSVITSSSYSQKRWNAYYTTVDFAVPPNDYDKVIALMGSASKEIVRQICADVMPAKTGFDVMDVTASISLEDTLQKVDTMEDLTNMTEGLPEKMRTVIIPDDIKAKAKVMSEVYLYTYCAENALRAFIEVVAIKNYGQDYLAKLMLNNKMKDKIKERKQLQEKKKWLSARGTTLNCLRERHF
jgi:hypothetical protein